MVSSFQENSEHVVKKKKKSINESYNADDK